MKYYNFLTKPHAQFWLKIYTSIIFLYSLSGYLLKAFPHNTTANILPGIAPLINLGKPYLDYWDVYPPGIYMFYYFLYFIGGNTFLSYAVAHVLMLSLIIYFAYKLFRFLSDEPILFYIAVSYFLSPLFISYTLPNEIVGLFFSFLGLYIYTSNSSGRLYNFFLANFFLITAAFIKEIFFLPAFCVILYTILKGESRKFISSFLGLLGSLTLIYLYMHNLQIYNEVIQNYIFKFSLFSFENILQKGFLLIAPVLFLCFYVVFSKNSSIKKLLKELDRSSVIYFYSVLILFSFLIIGRDDGGHFDIPKIFPLFFIFIPMVKKASRNMKILSILLVIFVSGYFLKFQHSTYSYLLIEPSFSISETYSPPEVSRDLADSLERLKPSILYLYGWGSTNFYYNLNIQPYSKYWIVNPQILTTFQINELKEEISIDPPEYIYYCGFDANCEAGFDYENFEENYINFYEIVSNCYVNIEKNFYHLQKKSCLENIRY